MPRKRVRFHYSEQLNRKKSPPRKKNTQSGQKEYWYLRVRRRQTMLSVNRRRR